MNKRMGNMEDRARQFAKCRGQNVLAPLGAGYDGTVFSTDVNTAIKVFAYEKLYQLAVEIRLPPPAPQVIRLPPIKLLPPPHPPLKTSLKRQLQLP